MDQKEKNFITNDIKTIGSTILGLEILRENITSSKEITQQTLDVAINYLCMYKNELIERMNDE